MLSPLFIMGTQRSGTTLLTRILSAHPDIFIQNELDLPKVFEDTSSTDSVIEGIKRQIFIESGSSLDDLVADKALWGLKDPQLTEYIDVLRKFLPQSKFIIIVRDGRGVTNSYMENKWGLGTNAYYGAQRWMREVNEQLGFMAEMPDNFLFIRYEDLVTDLETTLGQVCEFLACPLAPEMLEYDKQESYYNVQRENVHTFKKPDITLSEKWKSKLSHFEISVVEAVAGDLLENLGYTKVGRPVKLSKLQLFYFKWHQKIIGEIQIQYRWRQAVWRARKQQKERKEQWDSQ